MLYRVACLILLAIAFVRGASILTHEPMIGLANNYDMIRVQGCIDAYPSRPDDIAPWANSWQGPIKRYQFRDDVHPGCFLTSEALFAFALLPALHRTAQHNADGTFPLTAIGWFKFICLFSACCAVSIALLTQHRNRGALANSLLAAVLLFDPAITIYFNTFYAEFAAIFFAYLAVASAFIVVRQEKPSYIWLSICAGAIALMCMSKLQHIAFGLFLLFVFLMSCRMHKTSIPRSLIIAIGAGAIAGGFGQWMHMRSAETENMGRANLTNTILEAILGSSPSPATTAQRLGLPASCSTLAGKNWFAPEIQKAHPCPELFSISRTRFLSLAVTEPDTIARTLIGGVQRARPWIPKMLGKVEGSISAPVPDEFFSWSDSMDRLPQGLFALLLAAPPILTLALVRLWRRKGSSLAATFVLLFCACYPWLSLVSIVFGDGFADTAKQFHLGMAALLAFWLLIPALLAMALVEMYGETRASTPAVR